MASQRDVKNRIESVKNIRKITRAMEMVAAARLRRAEQRIAHLRPYAGAIRRMTRQAAQAAGGEIPSLPILQEHDEQRRVGDPARHRRPRARGRVQLADPAGRAARGGRVRGRRPGGRVLRLRPPRRLVADLPRPRAAGRLRRVHRAPRLRQRARDRQGPVAAYVDGQVDRVEIFYNGYVSPLTQEVRRETLLPLQQATILEAGDDEDGGRGAHASTTPSSSTSPTPRRSCSAWSPTTSRSRSSARCWSRRPPSTARA